VKRNRPNGLIRDRKNNNFNPVYPNIIYGPQDSFAAFHISIATVLVFEQCNELRSKVKLSLCLTKHHAMKTYWGVEI
jgi:hypothetical protein